MHEFAIQSLRYDGGEKLLILCRSQTCRNGSLKRNCLGGQFLAYDPLKHVAATLQLLPRLDQYVEWADERIRYLPWKKNVMGIYNMTNACCVCHA